MSASDKVFVNTQMDIETEKKVSEIAFFLHISRSETIRLAVEEFLNHHYADCKNLIYTKVVKGKI
jgi:hypothetical protein